MADIDIDVDDYLNCCTNYEIQEVIEWLIENEEIPNINSKQENVSGVDEQEFQDALIKLRTKWNMLSNEDTSFIVKLASKF